MLLSELLNKPVLSPQGDTLGRVVDVRFRRSARNRRHEGELELIALIMSPHSRLSYYGYERGTVNAPAAIARLIAWMHRDSQIVPWECVSRVGDEGVVLGVTPPRIPLDPRRPIDEKARP